MSDTKWNARSSLGSNEQKQEDFDQPFVTCGIYVGPKRSNALQPKKTSAKRIMLQKHLKHNKSGIKHNEHRIEGDNMM